MSKKLIHTNLVGKRVRLTDEARTFGIWHSKGCQLWTYSGEPPVGEFTGDFALIPGGKEATAEIVTVHLNPDIGIVAGLKWEADGTIRPDIQIEWLQVIEDGE